MHFNFADIAILAYVVFGVIWARRRGLGVEVQSAVGWLVAMLTGSGIYRWTTRGLEQVSHATGLSFGIFSFVAIFVVAWLMVRRLKGRIRDYAEKQFAESRHLRNTAMIAGGLRAFFLSSFVMLFIMILPIGFLRKPFQEGSLVGRVLNHVIMPVHKFTRAEEPLPSPPTRTNAPPISPYNANSSKQF
jgi:uncharacterized membrane protein required for colicin V production